VCQVFLFSYNSINNSFSRYLLNCFALRYNYGIESNSRLGIVLEFCMITDPLSGFSSIFTLTSLPFGSTFGLAFKFLLETSFFWLPVLLGTGVWKLWITYKQSEFIFNQKSTLLEIKIPLDVLKSPVAMELFLTSLFQTGGESTWIDRLIKGKSRPWFSLELVSLEGQVKFFIWTRPAWKNYIESQIYAQFQGVEINEVPDYVLPVKFDPENVVIWGCQFKLNKPDPYPIKTYVDNPPDGFGMIMFPGTDTKFQVDPISPTIEYLGSLGPGEQAWIQILVRAHKNDRASADRKWYNPFTWTRKADWKQALKSEIDKINKKEKEGKKLSKADNDAVAALERSVRKLPFETGIRALYVAEKAHFNSINISGLTGSFRQYNSNNLNGFAPTGSTSFNYPWQDYKNIRLNGLRRSILDAYKRRSYFLPPYKKRHFILNTEELATIFHFPSATVTTPTLARVATKKGEPPANLPI
jgi:hypothetical protein